MSFHFAMESKQKFLTKITSMYNIYKYVKLFLNKEMFKEAPIDRSFKNIFTIQVLKIESIVIQNFCYAKRTNPQMLKFPMFRFLFPSGIPFQHQISHLKTVLFCSFIKNPFHVFFKLLRGFIYCFSMLL